MYHGLRDRNTIEPLWIHDRNTLHVVIAYRYNLMKSYVTSNLNHNVRDGSFVVQQFEVPLCGCNYVSLRDRPS